MFVCNKSKSLLTTKDKCCLDMFLLAAPLPVHTNDGLPSPIMGMSADYRPGVTGAEVPSALFYIAMCCPCRRKTYTLHHENVHCYGCPWVGGRPRTRTKTCFVEKDCGNCRLQLCLWQAVRAYTQRSMVVQGTVIIKLLL